MISFSTLLRRSGRIGQGCVSGVLLALLPLLSRGQTTIVNYDFNSATAYPVAPAATAPGISSTGTGGTQTFSTATGISTGAGAYTANPTGGNALSLTSSNGTDKYFDFALSGPSLPKYSAFKLYLQSYRSSTGAATIALQYSLNGGPFNSFSPAAVPGTTVFAEGGFDLSGLTTLKELTSLTLRLLPSSASGTVRIDNFQVQAVNTVDPLISSLAPNSAEAGSPDVALTVTGSNFRSGAVVSFNGQDLATVFNSATSLTAAVPAAAVATTGSYPVTVTNPPVTGAAASPPAPAVTFLVTPAVPHWTGPAGIGSWFDPANWSTGVVPGLAPGSTDDVLLDHRYVAGSYTVSLDQNTAVSIKSLTVNPGAGDSIFALVPVTNTVNPPLTLTNTGAGAVTLAIYNKGVVTNANGAASGAGINVAGTGATAFIYNGGSYRHSSRTGHAGVADNLNPAVGTEQGFFDFRPPAGTNASTTLSASGRSYGTLILRARPGAGGTYSYAGSGTTLTVRGNLLIGAGVTFTATINNDLRLAGDLRSQGVFQFRKTSPPSPTSQLVLNGSKSQLISGTFLLDAGVGLALSNPAGATLATPAQLDGPLTLTSGALTTSATNLLTLTSAASVNVGSGGTSFINGPLARQTAAGPLSNLLFPTGSGAAYRPLVLNATTQDATSYLVTQKEGPAANRTTLLPGGPAALPALTRVSKVRAYTITPTPAANNFSGTVTLSFGPDDQVNAPTDAGLVVGKNSGAGWENIGRSAVSVSTPAPTGGYASGTLTSGPFTSFSDFALARTNAGEALNPLPVSLSAFAARREAGAVRLSWTTASELNNHHFEAQRSLDGRTFASVAKVSGHGTTAQQSHYTALDPAAPAQKLYYRLAQVDEDGQTSFSTVVALAGAEGTAKLTPYPNPARDRLTVPVPAGTFVQVLDLTGRVLQTSSLPPSGELTLPVGLPIGTYLLRTGTGQVWRFSKE